eukprot:343875-Chlamydomonas_euryale.AAC.1
MLQPAATVPIDRLRYQARLIFDEVDVHGSGEDLRRGVGGVGGWAWVVMGRGSEGRWDDVLGRVLAAKPLSLAAKPQPGRIQGEPDVLCSHAPVVSPAFPPRRPAVSGAAACVF